MRHVLRHLQIFAEENPPKRVNRPEACGLRHLAFSVDSVEQTVNELAEVGIECEPIRVDDYTVIRQIKHCLFRHIKIGLL